MRRLAAVLLVVVAASTACASKNSTSPTPAPTSTVKPIELWPLPKDPLARIREAGLVAERHETLVFHVHAHLDVFKNGRPVLVPGGIGINFIDPGVQHGDVGGFPAYGSIKECDKPCISPLHTHDATGVIHTESATAKPNTFGEFLAEWDVTLPKAARIYVDGSRYTGDVAKIQLTDRKEIAIVIGTPPSEIPAVFPTLG